MNADIANHPSRGPARRPAAVLLALAALLAACTGPEDPIDEQRGNWLLINYWAQWCKPCIREIPELNAIDQREGWAVLGVNFDGATGEALDSQIGSLGIEFPTLAEDPAGRFNLERPQVLPTTLVIDPEGRLQRVLVGPQTQESIDAATSGESRGSGNEQGTADR